jgi:hypothetical protein
MSGYGAGGRGTPDAVATIQGDGWASQGIMLRGTFRGRIPLGCAVSGWSLLVSASVQAVQALYGAYRNLAVIHGMQEVWGSNPHSSTSFPRSEYSFKII